MQRTNAGWLAALLISPAIFGQNAQLPRKGRQPDRTPAVPATPIRKLPRKGAPAIPVAKPAARPVIPAAPVSEDRLRPLLRGTPSPVSTPGPDASNKLPRAVGAAPERAAAIPAIRATAIRNRWYIFPAALSSRYDDGALDAIYSTSRLWDPYHRNPIKGDYPIVGRRYFFVFTGLSETTAQTRRIPVPSVASAASPGEYGFFGRGEQFAVIQNFRFSLDLFRGSAGFRPVDWEIRITPEFNINYALARENALIEQRRAAGLPAHRQQRGHCRSCSSKSACSANGRISISPRCALGIQRFTSDFRGFIYLRRAARRAPVRHVPQQRLPVQPGVLQHARKGHQQRPQPLAQPAAVGLGRQSLLERFPHQGLQPEFQRALQPRPAVVPDR